MEQIGNIHIIEAEDNFKRVHKSIIENDNIDCETLGVYTRIIVLGLKWNLNIKGLSSHLGLSDTRIRKDISLLEKEGYIVRTAVKGDGGKFLGWDYKVLPTPIDESQRSNAGKRTSQKTDTPLNGQHRQRTTPSTDNTENGEENNNRLKGSIDLKENKTKNKSFNFKGALLDLGIDSDVVDDWLDVRKKKKATNSERAFNKIKNEIEKSGMSANECITIAVDRCWIGFEADWVKNTKSRYNKSQKTVYSDQPKVKLHPALRVIDDEGTLNDGTFLKNGARFYFSKSNGGACSIPPSASPMPSGNSVFEYDYKLGWYECE